MEQINFFARPRLNQKKINKIRVRDVLLPTAVGRGLACRPRGLGRGLVRFLNVKWAECNLKQIKLNRSKGIQISSAHKDMTQIKRFQTKLKTCDLVAQWPGCKEKREIFKKKRSKRKRAVVYRSVCPF